MPLGEDEENFIVEHNQELAKCNVCHKKFGRWQPICPECREEYKQRKAAMKKKHVETTVKQTTLEGVFHAG